MTKTTCDICEKECTKHLRIEFLNGEHPHNGSEMTKVVDVCLECAPKLANLKCMIEFDEFRLLGAIDQRKDHP